MNRDTAKRILGEWRSHERGKPIAAARYDLGWNDMSLVSSVGGMAVCVTAEIPGAIPSDWYVQIGDVTNIGWVLGSTLRIEARSGRSAFVLKLDTEGSE